MEALEQQLLPHNVYTTIYQSGKSKEAGARLGAIPKTEALTMPAQEFRTVFRNRLLIPHLQLVIHKTCACGKDVDLLGVHMQKCRLDGNLTNITLAEMARSCGLSAKVEVTGIFNSVDPTSRQRMDLVILDPGKPTALWDFVITNPVSVDVFGPTRSNSVQLNGAIGRRQWRLGCSSSQRHWKFTESGETILPICSIIAGWDSPRHKYAVQPVDCTHPRRGAPQQPGRVLFPWVGWRPIGTASRLRGARGG
jgi:hypothetical protein